MKEAGLTKGAFSQHFDSKDALLAETVEQAKAAKPPSSKDGEGAGSGGGAGGGGSSKPADGAANGMGVLGGPVPAAGVPFEIVPGVTSAVAAPAYAGIPLTHRDFTSTVAFVTGHEDPTKEDSSIAWDKIATGIGTLVFFMGVGQLPEIVKRLVEHGRSPETPAAVIRWGTRAEQRVVTGTLATLVERSAGVKPPALIVVGGASGGTCWQDGPC